MSVFLDKKRKTYYCKFKKNGVSYFKRGFANKQSALLYELNIVEENNKLVHNYLISDINVMFKNHLDLKYRCTSSYRYSSLFNNHVEPLFKNTKIEQVDDKFLDRINVIINKLNYKDKRNIIFLTKEFLKFSETYGVKKVNLSRLYTTNKKRIEKNEYDFYTENEFDLFLSYVHDPLFVFGFYVLFYYGLRISELRGLKHKDINIKEGTLKIRRTISSKHKGKSTEELDVKTHNSLRTLPISNEFIILYSRLGKRKDNSFVFASLKHKNKVTSESSFKRMQVQTCSLCDLRVIKLHEFRHSCATFLLSKNIDYKVVAQFLGHTPTMTLNIYSHLLDNSLDVISDFYNKKRKE